MQRKNRLTFVLALVEHLIPDPADRRKVLWDTPARLFGFGEPLEPTVR